MIKLPMSFKLNSPILPGYCLLSTEIWKNSLSGTVTRLDKGCAVGKFHGICKLRAVTAGLNGLAKK